MAALNVADHVKQHAAYDMLSHVDGDVVRTCKPKTVKDGGLAQQRLLAVHAAIKACQLAKVPAVLWGSALDTWMLHCTVNGTTDTLQLMIPFDSLTSIEHFGLLYVRTYA